MRCRLAFTLIELLVVVAVVMVIIAILIPSLSRARASSRRSACLSNVRGLSQSLHLYITEWDAMLPASSLSVPISATPWSQRLERYGSGEELRSCPEVLEPNPMIYTFGTASKPWNQPVGTLIHMGAYAINGWLYGPFVGIDEDSMLTDSDDMGTGNYSVGNAYRLPMVGNVSNIPTFADAIWPESFPLPTDKPPIDLSIGSGGSPGLGAICISRHGRSVNVAFYDDHAENIPLAGLWALDWNRLWVAPQPPMIR